LRTAAFSMLKEKLSHEDLDEVNPDISQEVKTWLSK
jgi:hypothetical protein